MKRFALIGAAGYIAPRHLKAIHDTGNRLVAALDPNDSVGILDRYFPDALFFTSEARFERFLHQQRLDPHKESIDYVSICSPNSLHDVHIRMALYARVDAICEKPIVINPWNLDMMEKVAEETGRRVYTILQLRLHPVLIALKQDLEAAGQAHHDVTLTYVTQRGSWYDISWKGSDEKSGGLVMNIGVHFFDMCIWLFGPAQRSVVHLAEPRRWAGLLELERARVRWFLSIRREDIPAQSLDRGQPALRSMVVDGKEIEFTMGFNDLHTDVYRGILAGDGCGIPEARPSIELVHRIRHTGISPVTADAHPRILKG